MHKPPPVPPSMFDLPYHAVIHELIFNVPRVPQSAVPLGTQLALRFEYISDRAAPGSAPVLHLYNTSRVARKRRAFSAVYIEGPEGRDSGTASTTRLMPGDRGLKLAAGDVIIVGLNPSGSNAAKAMRIAIEPVPEPGAAEAEPEAMMHVAPANGMGSISFSPRIAQALKAAAKGVESVTPSTSPRGEGAAPPPSSLREAMARGPGASLIFLKAEVLRNPGNSSECPGQ